MIKGTLQFHKYYEHQTGKRIQIKKHKNPHWCEIL